MLQGYHLYIDEFLPSESPYLYGLHPNAEIGFLTITSEKLFRSMLEMQPNESDASGGGGGVSREEKVSLLDRSIHSIQFCVWGEIQKSEIPTCAHLSLCR